MQTSSVVEAFERAVLAVAHEPEFGAVEIVAQHARHHGRSVAFSIVIDKAGGVDIALCEALSRRLNRALDAFEEPYTLEVESAGLKRALSRPADYERFQGKPVRIVTAELVGGKKTHRGTLAGTRGASIVLDESGTTVLLPINDIKSAKLEFDPRSDLRRAKEQKRKHD